MRKHAAAFILFLILGCVSAPRAAVDYPQNLRMNQYDADLVELEWEIKTLNLINGLYLTDAQMRDMLDVLHDLERVNARYGDDLLAAKDEVKQAYEALRDDLIDDDLVDPDTERRAGEAKQRLEDLVLDYAARLKNLESSLLGIFTEKQTAIADEFLPCIIPPKSANNTRIGQTGGSNPRMENMLEQLRDVPEAQFRQQLPTFLARHIDNLEKRHGIMSQMEKEAEYDRLYDLAISIREMDAVEFELKKSQLASEIMPRQARVQPKDQTKARSQGPRKKYQLSVVASFLLNENLIPILEQKLGL